jgi:hypothetical protein
LLRNPTSPRKRGEVKENDIRNDRHCERSEAIQNHAKEDWIASSLRFSQ